MMYEARGNEVWWVPQTSEGAAEQIYATCQSAGAAMRIAEALEEQGARSLAEMREQLDPR